MGDVPDAAARHDHWEQPLTVVQVGFRVRVCFAFSGGGAAKENILIPVWAGVGRSFEVLNGRCFFSLSKSPEIATKPLEKGNQNSLGQDN